MTQGFHFMLHFHMDYSRCLNCSDTLIKAESRGIRCSVLAERMTEHSSVSSVKIKIKIRSEMWGSDCIL
ncbi:hypothetical protein KOW79_004789 [Hemibagrus wyckioides]|uniref:Uncharacterized protein n=1 Tax=Hemibagrus wyckioides TaxID=337641 RepID=A0A9D3NXQ1_9TELE|nr:hypothetical protein KOW79_004789 [Hemibagrus wyckioides]